MVHSVFIILQTIIALTVSNKVLDFWTKMSPQSVVKCHYEPSLEDNLEQKFRDLFQTSDGIKPFVYTYKCQPNEKPMKFSFKGQIIDGQLHGAGKLKLRSK